MSGQILHIASSSAHHPNIITHPTTRLGVTHVQVHAFHEGPHDAVDHVGKNFISINDMSNEQLLNLFELGKELELFNRSKIDLFDDRMLALMFFQPSTRTRMSFQTAMERMGGKRHRRGQPQGDLLRRQGGVHRGHHALRLAVRQPHRPAPLRRGGGPPRRRVRGVPGHQRRVGALGAPDPGAPRPLHAVAPFRSDRGAQRGRGLPRHGGSPHRALHGLRGWPAWGRTSPSPPTPTDAHRPTSSIGSRTTWAPR